MIESFLLLTYSGKTDNIIFACQKKGLSSEYIETDKGTLTSVLNNFGRNCVETVGTTTKLMSLEH